MPAKGKPIFQNNTDEHPVEDRYEIRSDRYPPALRCSYVRPNGVRCRRFAVRMGTCCPFHHNSKTVAKRKKEAELVRDLAEIIRDSIEGVKLAQVSLREGAPEAVQFLRDVVGNEDVAMPTRVKAAESLVRFSGTSLERPDQNTINVLDANGPNATDLIRERLDRLQSAAELASDSPDHPRCHRALLTPRGAGSDRPVPPRGVVASRWISFRSARLRPVPGRPCSPVRAACAVAGKLSTHHA